MAKKKIIIADGNNLGWMAYGITPLSYKGERIEAIFIGLNMIRAYLREFEPDEFYLVWDGGRDKDRLALYPDYKKRRKELTKSEMKERSGFFDQLKKLQGVMTLLGVVQYRIKGREADDVIYDIMNRSVKEGGEVLIVSTDKDFYQLLSDDVSIYNPVKKNIIKAKDVEEKYSIPVSYFIDYKALAGDPSDKLPGVRGIGPTWATWLINNVLVEGAKYDELTKAQCSAVNKLFVNLDDYVLMKKLIRLKAIKKKEMKEGRFEDRPDSVAQLQERAIIICEQFGFEKHQKSFPSFIQPFEILWRRGE